MFRGHYHLQHALKRESHLHDFRLGKLQVCSRSTRTVRTGLNRPWPLLSPSPALLRNHDRILPVPWHRTAPVRTHIPDGKHDSRVARCDGTPSGYGTLEARPDLNAATHPTHPCTT